MVDQLGCGCGCNDGRDLLILLPAVPGDDILARCWCTQCGGSEGRCEIRLTNFALRLATLMGNTAPNGGVICFSCRTPLRQVTPVPDPLRQETPDPDPLQQETSSGYSTAPSTDPRDEDDSDAVDDVQHDVGSSEVEEEQSPETDHDLLSQETLPLPGPMNSWSSPAPSTEPWSPGSELPDIVVLDPPPTPSPPRPPRRSLRRSFSSFGNDDDKTPPSKRKRDD
jgi:hypothetical protein